MNDKLPKTKKPIDIDAVNEDTNHLPPLDGDEVDRVNPEELVSYLDVVDESKESSIADQSEPVTEEDAFREDLLDTGESSWVDDGDEPVEADLSSLVKDDDEQWSDRAEDPLSDLDTSWFVDELDESTDEEDDGGALGQLDEELSDLDEESLEGWASLDSDDEEAERGLEQMMTELGIQLPYAAGEDLQPVLEVSRGRVLESQFLGPVEGTVAAAVVVNGEPIAVGDGLFVLGADGMLHRVSGSKPFGDWLATNVCAHGETLFVGTQFGGAFATGDQGASFEPINGWNTLGFSTASKDSSQRISTSFHLAGQQTGKGFRLLGRTGEGQLFCSLDQGRSWTGLMTPWHCSALAPVHGTESVIALVDASRRTRLVQTNDLESWNELTLPPGFVQPASRGAVSIAASTQTLIIGIDDPIAPLYCSLDGGRQWKLIKALRGVTAVGLDLENPGWMAAAVYQAARDLGIVRITEDGGLSWQTVLITGKAVEQTEPESSWSDEEPVNRVCDLIIEMRRARQIVAVTHSGIYKVVLAHRGVSH